MSEQWQKRSDALDKVTKENFLQSGFSIPPQLYAKEEMDKLIELNKKRAEAYQKLETAVKPAIEKHGFRVALTPEEIENNSKTRSPDGKIDFSKQTKPDGAIVLEDLVKSITEKALNPEKPGNEVVPPIAPMQPGQKKQR